ncbi:hypothetical protein [Dethiothermospora halolimnae]|uniref:hypothetical protein n=1 Tax=Dethiothermospora halolimnae TaxID=3114390 RepID=UPI003CCBBD6C
MFKKIFKFLNTHTSNNIILHGISIGVCFVIGVFAADIISSLLTNDNLHLSIFKALGGFVGGFLSGVVFKSLD